MERATVAEAIVVERPLDLFARLRLQDTEAVAGGEENAGHERHGTSAS